MADLVFDLASPFLVLEQCLILGHPFHVWRQWLRSWNGLMKQTYNLPRNHLHLCKHLIEAWKEKSRLFNLCVLQGSFVITRWGMIVLEVWLILRHQFHMCSQWLRSWDGMMKHTTCVLPNWGMKGEILDISPVCCPEVFHHNCTPRREPGFYLAGALYATGFEFTANEMSIPAY